VTSSRIPKKPKITPNDADVRGALSDIAAHPEITLSRREILRFILVEPTARSEEIQAILKLDDVGQIRSTLNTAQNRLQTQLKHAESTVRTSRETLQRHLQIETFLAADVLRAVNPRRKTLGLSAIEALAATTSELSLGRPSGPVVILADLIILLPVGSLTGAAARRKGRSDLQS
jgi:hypothetical protein